MKIGLFYGSTLGAAKSVAEELGALLEAEIFDVAKGIDSINDYTNLIFGTNTWGYGDLQDDWEGVKTTLEKINFTGKKVAIYSTGDAEGYSDTFVDAIGILGEIVEKNGGILIGFTSTEGYVFSDSKALRDDMFIGLAIDDNNQGNLTKERVGNWATQLKGEF
ncbi:MAG: flavodoxin [Fusobacteriaceae bacterium]|nr:flavodoxin [Fusobacteriaceae bacterium]